MQTDQDIAAYYLKNEILILKILNELFLKQNFQRDLLRKVFYFKIKEINLKNNKMYETKYQVKQKKTKSPSRIFDNPKKKFLKW